MSSVIQVLYEAVFFICFCYKDVTRSLVFNSVFLSERSLMEEVNGMLHTILLRNRHAKNDIYEFICLPMNCQLHKAMFQML